MPVQTRFTERDLTTWDFVRHFSEYLQEECVPVVGDFLKRQTYRGKTGLINEDESIKVLIGERGPVAFPKSSKAVIRIVKKPKKSEWMATRTKKDTYSVNIDCMTRVIVDRGIMDMFIDTFASAVQNFLNDIERLQFKVRGTNVTVFDSWCENCETGFTADGALRIARLPWTGWVANSYAVK